MNRKAYYFLVIILLLTSCRHNPVVQNSDGQKVVLERRSPAVGSDGKLVESVGIETVGGIYSALLKTGCATPCKRSEIFSTAADNQSSIEVRLFRGNDGLVSKNHPLGFCHIVDIPPAPRATPVIEVVVEAADQEISISAFDETSKKPFSIQCSNVPG